MKRHFLAIIAMLFWLASCGTSETAPNDRADSPDHNKAAVQTEVSVQQSEESDETEAVSTEIDSIESEDAEDVSFAEPENVTEEKEVVPVKEADDETQYVFSIDGELPDIGKFNVKCDRFYKEYTPEFIPSDKYGEIVPYLGKFECYRIAGSSDLTINVGMASYGLCTSDGKIVMDAQNKYQYMKHDCSDDGFSVYTLSVTEDEPKERADYYSPDKTLIIPETGEWCLQFDGQCVVSEVKNGYISIEDVGYGSRLYDYDGNELTNISGYDEIILTDFDLIGVKKWYDSFVFQAYINFDGKTVMGPYKKIGPFNSSGIAQVEDDDGTFLIDTEGNTVIGPYKSIQYFNDSGVAVVEDEDGHFLTDARGNIVMGPYKNIRSFNGSGIAVVEDKEGFFLTDAEGTVLTKTIYSDISWYGANKIYESTNGVFAAVKKENDMECDVFDSDGKYIKTVSGSSSFAFSVLHDGEIIYSYYQENGDYALKKLSDNSDVISNAEQLNFEEQYWGIDYSPDGKYIIYETYEERSEHDPMDILTYEPGYESHIYDVESETVIESISGYLFPRFVGKNNEYIRFVYNSESVLTRCFYDLNNRKVLFENCDVEYIDSGEKGYFLVCYFNRCALYDEKMNLLLETYAE